MRFHAMPVRLSATPFADAARVRRRGPVPMRCAVAHRYADAVRGCDLPLRCAAILSNRSDSDALRSDADALRDCLCRCRCRRWRAFPKHSDFSHNRHPCTSVPCRCRVLVFLAFVKLRFPVPMRRFACVAMPSLCRPRLTAPLLCWASRSHCYAYHCLRSASPTLIVDLMRIADACRIDSLPPPYPDTMRFAPRSDCLRRAVAMTFIASPFRRTSVQAHSTPWQVVAVLRRCSALLRFPVPMRRFAVAAQTVPTQTIAMP